MSYIRYITRVEGVGRELTGLQANFFRYIGPILTFAFAGTFISAVVLGVLLWLWTRLPLYGFNISFVEAFSVGATLSATDPVTILAIFNAYKVDPKLYTIIFGESILNDAIAIVLFETAQKYVPDVESGKQAASLTVFTFFEAIGIFLLVFLGSLVIGVAVGILTTLGLKFTLVRRFPKTESCLVILIAYASYFFSTAINMSGESPNIAKLLTLTDIGIVSLLFCGITLKHYAYYNMSRRTQLTTKFVFQVTSQLTENFIFIYLGLTLFTEKTLDFKPLFILITVIGVCAARYVAVFPLSKLINFVIRFRAKQKGEEQVDDLPHSYQVMLFWAGLRGAVGVALAAGLKSAPDNVRALQATILVVVVLTIIIFGGTTSRMLEIMGIRTGVVEELDSDDEFDVEVAANGTYYKRGGTAFGHTPTRGGFNLKLNNINGNSTVPESPWEEGYSSGSNRPSPPSRSLSGRRNNSTHSQREREAAAQALLNRDAAADDEYSDSDLPPAAPKRSPKRRPSPPPEPGRQSTYPPPAAEGAEAGSSENKITATGAIRDFFTGKEDHAEWFKRLDDAVIKPTLLLDQSNKGGGSSSGNGGGNGHGHGQGHGGNA